MEKGEDFNFEHGGEKGGKDKRGDGGRGKTRTAPGGERWEEEKHEGRMRARALPERRPSHGKAETGGQVHAQRGSMCGRGRLGVQRHSGPTPRSVKPVNSEKNEGSRGGLVGEKDQKGTGTKRGGNGREGEAIGYKNDKGTRGTGLASGRGRGLGKKSRAGSGRRS